MSDLAKQLSFDFVWCPWARLAGLSAVLAALGAPAVYVLCALNGPWLGSDPNAHIIADLVEVAWLVLLAALWLYGLYCHAQSAATPQSFRRTKALWTNAHYCHRCNLVVLPGSRMCGTPSQFHTLCTQIWKDASMETARALGARLEDTTPR